MFQTLENNSIYTILKREQKKKKKQETIEMCIYIKSKYIYIHIGLHKVLAYKIEN